MNNDRQTFSARQTFTTKAADAKIKFSSRTFVSADGSTIEIPTLTGYPIVWGATSSDRGGYKVRLNKDSANFTSSVLALWNHDFGQPLAGTTNQTLRILAADDTGVPIELDLDMNTTAGRNTAAYVRSELVGGMSFSMANGFEDYTETKDDSGDKIVNAAKYTVDEVSVTPIPAFSDSSIGVKQDDSDPEAHDDPAPVGTPPVRGGMSKLSEAQIKLRQSRLNTFSL